MEPRVAYRSIDVSSKAGYFLRSHTGAADKLKKSSDYDACTGVLAYVIVKQRLVLRRSSWRSINANIFCCIAFCMNLHTVLFQLHT